jgi:hypothetical protein
MSNRIAILTFTFIMLALLIGVLYLLNTSGSPIVPPSFHLAPEAEYLFQDSARYGGDIFQVSTYYWSSLDIKDIEQHYLRFLFQFLPGNSHQDWLITGFYSDISSQQPLVNLSSDFLAHSSFCRPIEQNCLTLSLVDMAEIDPQQIPVLYPGTFLRSPNSVLQNLLGKMIIYSIYERRF